MNMITGRLEDNIRDIGDGAARMRCPRGRFAKAIAEAKGELDVAVMALHDVADIGGIVEEYVAARACVAEAVPIASSFVERGAVDVAGIMDALGKMRAESKRLWSKDRKASTAAKKKADDLAAQLAVARKRRDVVDAVARAQLMMAPSGASAACLDGHIHGARWVASTLYALNGHARWVIQGSDCSKYWEGEGEGKRPPRLPRFVRVCIAGNRYTIEGPGAVDDVDTDVIARSIARIIGSDPMRTIVTFNEETRGGVIHFGQRSA